jgi:hypothetical protein
LSQLIAEIFERELIARHFPKLFLGFVLVDLALNFFDQR